jgi:hypothetical protein
LRPTSGVVRVDRVGQIRDHLHHLKGVAVQAVGDASQTPREAESLEKSVGVSVALRAHRVLGGGDHALKLAGEVGRLLVKPTQVMWAACQCIAPTNPAPSAPEALNA